MKNLILPAFIIIALVQWFVPGKMIFEKENVLEKGQSWRFLTEPIDPSHPFIGRYIVLNFKEVSFEVDPNSKWTSGSNVYVLLQNDKDGFATIKDISEKEPGGSADYVKAKIRYTLPQESRQTIYIDYPFDKFYMEEFKAPKAEDIYREANRDSTRKTWALVKIYKGDAVTEDVIIDNKPVLEWMK